MCSGSYSLAWSLAAYRTLTTAVSVSVFTEEEGAEQVEMVKSQIHIQTRTPDYFTLVCGRANLVHSSPRRRTEPTSRPEPERHDRHGEEFHQEPAEGPRGAITSQWHTHTSAHTTFMYRTGHHLDQPARFSSFYLIGDWLTCDQHP